MNVHEKKGMGKVQRTNDTNREEMTLELDLKDPCVSGKAGLEGHPK